MARPHGRRFVFPDPAALNAAYRRLASDPWVESCAVDLPECTLHVTLTPRAVPRRADAERWFRRLEKQLAG